MHQRPIPSRTDLRTAGLQPWQHPFLPDVSLFYSQPHSRPDRAIAADNQAALAVPGADKQQQVAEAHRRTSEAMLALRSTLRDEHFYLLQVCSSAHAL